MVRVGTGGVFDSVVSCVNGWLHLGESVVTLRNKTE